MVGPQGFLAYRQRALKERLGLTIPRLLAIQACQIVEGVGQIWVCEPQGLPLELVCFERALLSLLIVSLALLELPQISEATGVVGVRGHPTRHLGPWSTATTGASSSP
jgi:hypothetical protein